MTLLAASFFGAPAEEVARLALQHLGLVSVSTAIAALVGVPLGIVAAHRPRAGRLIDAVASGLQVVPSLALFGLLLPVPVIGGIGARSAVVALVLYALLPIIRGTATGLLAIDPAVREAAEAMGMTARQVLWQVELPLGRGVIAAGVRTALVIGVGVTTVAAAIGAGGLGTLIFRGLRMNDNQLVLAGAVPAALLALGLDLGLGALLAAPKPAHPAGRGARRRSRSREPRSSSRSSRGARSHGRPKEPRPAVTICTKDFTEQVILGELLAQELEARSVRVVRQFELGGNLCHQALLAGKVDVYPEYTGTAYTALLKLNKPGAALPGPAEVLAQVTHEYAEKYAVAVSAPLGFRNDFVLLVRRADQQRLSLKTVSDLARVRPRLRAGFGQDFISRPDGYAGLLHAYALEFEPPVRELDLSLTYRALAEGQLDVIAGDSTNGLIDALDLAPLEDDQRYFPPYQAVWLSRQDALARTPALAAAEASLAGALTTEVMRRLNREADVGKVAPAEVARRFLAGRDR